MRKTNSLLSKNLKTSIGISLLLLGFQVYGQDIVTYGSIEFEVKTNVYKQNENNPNIQSIKGKYPQFTTKFFSYTFKENRSLYKFTRNAENLEMYSFLRGMDESIWYNDFNQGSSTKVSNFDDFFLVDGHQDTLEWKVFLNQRRDIAGYDCKLAQTIVFDSVYVFAYYTDQIKVSGGPMSLGGLPGMILGVTIPRMHTSWIATKISPILPADSEIVKPAKGTKIEKLGLKDLLTKSFRSLNNASFLQEVLWTALL